MVTARKRQISAAFSAAAERYDEAAGVQRRVAGRLVELVSDRVLDPSPQHILEIGCGTGLLTGAIRKRWPRSVITATDIAHEMVAQAARHGSADRLMTMDGEQPTLGDERFDLILSSLTFQWFDNLHAALFRLRAMLRPGAALAFATMGAGSFSHWREAHEREGYSAGLPDYPTHSALQSMLGGFEDSWTGEGIVNLTQRGGRALMHHFRDIGAFVPRDGYRPLGPAAMRSVIERFDEDGGTATYHILYGGFRNG